MNSLTELLKIEMEKQNDFARISICCQNIYSIYQKNSPLYEPASEDYYYKNLNTYEKKDLYLHYNSIADILKDNKIDSEMTNAINGAPDKQLQKQYFTLKSFSITSNIFYNLRIYNIIELFDFLKIDKGSYPRIPIKTEKDAMKDIKRIEAYLKEVKEINNDLYNQIMQDLNSILYSFSKDVILILAKMHDNFISKYAITFLSLILSFAEDYQSTHGLATINILEFIRVDRKFTYNIKLKRKEVPDKNRAFEGAKAFMISHLFPNLQWHNNLIRAVINVSDYLDTKAKKTPLKVRKSLIKKYIKEQVRILSNIDFTFRIKNQKINLYNIVIMESELNGDHVILGISPEFMELVKLTFPFSTLIRKLQVESKRQAIEIIYYITYQNGRYLRGITRRYNLKKFIENISSIYEDFEKQKERRNYPTALKNLQSTMQELKYLHFIEDYQILDKNGNYYNLTDLKRKDIEADIYYILITLTARTFLEMKTASIITAEKPKISRKG